MTTRRPVHRQAASAMAGRRSCVRSCHDAATRPVHCIPPTGHPDDSDGDAARRPPGDLLAGLVRYPAGWQGGAPTAVAGHSFVSGSSWAVPTSCLERADAPLRLPVHRSGIGTNAAGASFTTW
jgi:hypothetical protein